MAEEQKHAKMIRETIIWFRGYISRDRDECDIPSLYGLSRAQEYFEKRAHGDDAGYADNTLSQERVTFEGLDRKMDAATANADAAPHRLRLKLKPAIPLTKAGKPDKRTVNALKRRAAAAKSAGKKVKGKR